MFTPTQFKHLAALGLEEENPMDFHVVTSTTNEDKVYLGNGDIAICVSKEHTLNGQKIVLKTNDKVSVTTKGIVSYTKHVGVNSTARTKTPDQVFHQE